MTSIDVAMPEVMNTHAYKRGGGSLSSSLQPRRRRRRVGSFNYSNQNQRMEEVRQAVNAQIRGGYTTNGHTPSRGSYRQKFNVLNARSDPVYPRPEVKNRDVTLDPGAATSSGAPVDLSLIPQGEGATERIGRQVAVKSVSYQFTLMFAPAGTRPLVLRHILFWDRQPNAQSVTPTTITDLLALQPFVTSPMNLDNTDRFVILADDRVTLSPNGTQRRIINGFRKINQYSTYLDDYGMNPNVPQSGALRLLFVSDEGANPPQFDGTWRVRFIDD